MMSRVLSGALILLFLTAPLGAVCGSCISGHCALGSITGESVTGEGAIGPASPEPAAGQTESASHCPAAEAGHEHKKTTLPSVAPVEAATTCCTMVETPVAVPSVVTASSLAPEVLAAGNDWAGVLLTQPHEAPEHRFKPPHFPFQALYTLHSTLLI